MDLIRGRDVDDAITLLQFAKQRASGMIEKVVRSAVANANETDTPPRNTLFVAKAWVDPGPVIKRFQPKDRGKAYPINKRTSHLVVTLDEERGFDMGQKVNPTGFRVGITEDWKSKWYAPKAAYGNFLVEDFRLRRLIDRKLNRQQAAAVS